MRERQCASCWMQLPKEGFGKRQWKLQFPVCLGCAEAARENEYYEWRAQRSTRTCAVCEEEKEKEGFGKKQWKGRAPKCLACAEQARTIEYAIGEEEDIQYHTLVKRTCPELKVGARQATAPGGVVWGGHQPSTGGTWGNRYK